MRVIPLAPLAPSVLTQALVRRGWDPGRADAAARGLGGISFIIHDLDEGARESVIAASRSVGVDCLTGNGWALVAGALSRMAGMTRPGFSKLPGDITESIGRQLRGFAETTPIWQTARGGISLEMPVVAGILNVTPDSFSDGGRFLRSDDALDHAETMASSGATIIDIGAESTRPGRPEPVSLEEEWSRLEPVLTALTRRLPQVVISVDTVKSEVARRALQHGAWIVNDVSGFRSDPDMANVCAAGKAGVVLMHSRGSVSDMATYDFAEYGDVVSEVIAEMRVQRDVALAAGLAADAIVVDPGLGFSKRPPHNYEVLRRLQSFRALGSPIMVGPSRKRFLRELVCDRMDLADDVTAAACVSAYHCGARLFRVHDVEKTLTALQVARSIEG